MSTAQDIRRGIAAYEHEQMALKRWIRMAGELPASQFDRALQNRGIFCSYRGADGQIKPKLRKLSGGGISGDSFVLGDMTGSEWAQKLDLLQYMCKLGDVLTKTVDGEVVYYLPEAKP